MRKIFFGILLFVVFLIIGFQVSRYVKEIMPVFEHANTNDLFKGDRDDRFAIILEEKVFVDQAFEIDKEQEKFIYIPLDFVQDNIEPHYFWDEEENILTLTTLKELITIQPEATYVEVNKQRVEYEYELLIIEESPYIALDFIIEWVPIQYTYYYNPSRVYIEWTNQIHKKGDVKNSQAYIREMPSNKGLIVTEVKKGDVITIYNEVDGWFYVKTRSGWLGYVEQSKVENIRLTSSKDWEGAYINKEYLPKEPINMVWHQVTNRKANDGLQKLLENTKGINVLSPTWFTIKDEAGNINSIADKSYVEWAHINGYQVWALVDNQFSKSLTHQVLQSTKIRREMIHQLIEYAIEYNLDGINIDFENVGSEDGQAFVQFIRELAIACYENELVLSIDAYVPAPWTAHYNRNELSKVADYIAIMAYDEHWSTSPVSGSVASIGFVEKGIINTLKEVPNDKIILGLPFYTRLWREEVVDGEIKVTSRAYSMAYIETVLEENEAKVVWDEESQQFYGEYYIEDVRYRVWIEEDKSIEEKMKLYERYELAGVAAWKLGLEKPSIWDIITDYITN
jgi:spore germination protein YaaH